MQICVFGLWHLGCVTAACAAEHHDVVGLDPAPNVVAELSKGTPPLFEPGLGELVQEMSAYGRLRFTADQAEALKDADAVWVTFDTPVNEKDEADYEYVEGQIASLFPYLRNGAIVLISSQMPVGSTARMEAAFRKAHPNRDVSFAYSPENLRLGKAIQVFRNPGRIVAGVRSERDRERLRPLLEPICGNILWMSVESAEMTKHALNAFLANSVAFINEIAAVCEGVGADAREVERGLKSDERIGPKAYLGAGGPFAGGTLARDIAFLTSTASRLSIPAPLLESVRTSNDLHKGWHRRKLEALLGTVKGKTISILGLTYKPGTDTLRRSAAVELSQWLSAKGARVRAFDPAVKRLPNELTEQIELCATPAEAMAQADAAVVSTEWPEFRSIQARDLISGMKTPIVLDANRFLEQSLGNAPQIEYAAVGRARRVA